MDLQALTALIARHEGRRNKVYKDSLGILSIGVGRNLEDLGLSDAEVDFLLRNDIERVISELNHAIPWWVALDPIRRMILVDMGFMGVPKLVKFQRMLNALFTADYRTAAAEMLDSTWAKQVGRRADELAAMMIHGTLESSR